MDAYEAGRLAEGDRLAARADVLAEKIESVLIALDEEGEDRQEPPVQSITRQVADAWDNCMRSGPAYAVEECRRNVEEYRRTGHGEWEDAKQAFTGPTSMWGKTTPAEHPEWFTLLPGHYREPSVVTHIRYILNNQTATGAEILDAGEDAWNSVYATTDRIRAGVARRREQGIDPMAEAKLFVRRARRKVRRR
ncbi:MAG: hypothetical protein GYA73_03570 [Planctomycetes bacterium]|nr:hypothetical protein [Planctomycetota bacterium]